MNELTIVIPTWKRSRELFECLSHIYKQLANCTSELRQKTKIIVVIDGDDQRLKTQLNKDYPNINVIMLGKNWSSLLPNSFGIAPLLVGYLCANSYYIMPWCDDERALVPNHIQLLYDTIDDTNTDFVYPKVKIWRNGNPYGPETSVIGTTPPRHGQITHYLFKSSNLYVYGMPDWGTHPVDWSLVDKWIKAGAKYTMLDMCTFEHRLDQ